MDRTNNRIGSIRFDDETILEVSQKGGGGAGVGGDSGLEARNLVTGESTNEAIEELTEDLEDAQETIETQAQTIEDQAGTIESQAQTIEDQQAIINAFPTIEALNVTANGTYSETGKAYSPVNVNVAADMTFLIDTRTDGPAWIHIFSTLVNNKANPITLYAPDTPSNSDTPTSVTGIKVRPITIAANSTLNADIHIPFWKKALNYASSDAGNTGGNNIVLGLYISEAVALNITGDDATKITTITGSGTENPAIYISKNDLPAYGGNSAVTLTLTFTFA